MSKSTKAITISNPYRGVNWDTYKPHKTELHCHTKVSDGTADFDEMIEAYYALGYDCLAIADHGVIDRSWTKLNVRRIVRLTCGKNPFKKPTGLTEERFREISEGVGRDGRGMLRVPFGTEHSPGGNRWAHVNSWLCDVHSAAVGRSDYTKAVRAVDRAGGQCVICHPSSAMKNVKLVMKNGKPALSEMFEDKHSSYINHVQQLMERYPSLLGIDIPFACDRKLWDILLRRFAPSGRSVFAVATSDEHDAEDIKNGLGWVEAMMPENTIENFRKCMEDGAFFAASRYVSFIFTPEFHAAHPNLLPALREEHKEHATKINELSDLYGELCMAPRPIAAPRPMVRNISIEEGVISIQAENYDVILWVSDGKYIASGDTINLNDCENLGAYVRAELWGPGGNLYTQPFLLQ